MLLFEDHVRYRTTNDIELETLLSVSAITSRVSHFLGYEIYSIVPYNL